MTSVPSNCEHPDTSLINPYEFVRKYECPDCRGVMACACDEEWATRLLGHQLAEATDLETRRSIRVTLGFQPGICRSCRGLPEIAYPKAELYGRTSKLRRYYWREIFIETGIRFPDWSADAGYDDLMVARSEHGAVYEEIEQQVINELKAEHATTPKYVYTDKAPSAVTAEHGVEVIDVVADYLPGHEGARSAVPLDGKPVTVEEFAAHYFKDRGSVVIHTESAPFHVLFATLLWRVVQDPADSLVRPAGFGSRCEETDGELVWVLLPEDFGVPGYWDRRRDALLARLDELRGLDVEAEFESELEGSVGLRDYLWACDPGTVETARQVLGLLPRATIVDIIEFLAGDYWGRYLGWPDLLVQSARRWFFTEVKSSGDRLSERQKSWIETNARYLGADVKLLKVHRPPIS